MISTSRQGCFAHNHPQPNVLIALLLVLALVPLTFGYAVFGEPYRPVFKRHRLSMPRRWPRHLNVVHISDLHVRASDRRLHRAQMAALGALKEQPDLVCVTGDIAEKVADID